VKEVERDNTQSRGCAISLLVILSCVFVLGNLYGQDLPLNARLTTKAWDALNKGDHERAITFADSCISGFGGSADRQQAQLEKDSVPPPPKGVVSETQKKAIFARGLLNDVATCYFIKGRSAENLKRMEEARQAYMVAMKYTYARCWDPKGWFWSPSEGASDRLNQLPPETKPKLPTKHVPKCSFEDSVTGWRIQDYKDSRACVQVLRSDDRAIDGRYSLKMIMGLVGGDAQQSKGEAWANMVETPPEGESAPMNLLNRTISAWVYAPYGSYGEEERPNGFQIFVKDENWKGEYGPWNDAVEDSWVRITLTVSASKPEGGWMAQGFDSKRIVAVGVKMGAGGGSSARYKGPVYVDAVDW